MILFRITDAEYETKLYSDESLKIVDPEGIVFEKVFEARRRLSGYGPTIHEQITRQVHVIMSPAEEHPEKGAFSISGAKILFRLEEGVHVAIANLVSMCGVGEFTLWIKGRQYGRWNVPARAGEEYTALCKEIYHAIDDEMGFNQEEWGIA